MDKKLNPLGNSEELGLKKIERVYVIKSLKKIKTIDEAVKALIKGKKGTNKEK